MRYIGQALIVCAATLSVSAWAQSNGTAPVQLKPLDIRCSFHLFEGGPKLLRDVFKAYGIQAEVEASVKNQPVRFDVDGVGFAEAADLVRLATGIFFAPLDARRVLVVSDTKENRAKYEPKIMETLTFPGASATDLTDLQNIALNIFGVESSTVQNDRSSLTLRGPGPELAALKVACAELFSGQSELLLDVHVYEVDKTRDTNTGVVPPNSATLFNARSEIDSVIANNSGLVEEIISEGLASAGNYSEILAALLASGELSGTVFNSPFVLFGGGLTETGAEWNSAAANMLLSSSEVKSLTQAQLHVRDQQEATFRSGEKYPVISSTYTASGSTSSSSTLTVPQIQYQDLGLTLKVKPFIGKGKNILLQLDLQVTSLEGESINHLPVLSNREYTSVVSLRGGQSALLLSVMSRQDSREITGIPIFNSATNRQAAEDDVDLVVLITPHLLRLAHPEGVGAMYLLPLH